MKLWYNNVAFHQIGTVSLVEESSEFAPAESPLREVVTLHFRIDSWLATYVENRTKLREVQAALREQNAVLKVAQETDPTVASSAEFTLYDQTATLVSDTFPTDVNEWGTTHQQIRLTFTLSKHDLVTNGMTISFTPTGGALFSLDRVLGWKTSIRTEWFDKKKDPREHVEESVVARGEFHGNMALSLADRRTALTTLAEQWKTEFTKKSGLLAYGGFSKTVRIEGLEAEVDQAVTKIVWGFTARYTRFPNEAGYAGVEYEAALRKDSDNGESFLSLTGRIIAESKSRAEAKLATVKAAVLSTYGFTAGQEARNDVKERNVGMSSYDGITDVGDGDAFVELAFSFEFRQRTPDHLSWSLMIDDEDSNESGIITRTYSGSVSCGVAAGSAPSPLSGADAAFWIAATKARELGENKHAMRIKGGLRREDRLTKSTGGIEFVKVDFAYVYRVRGSRIHLEMKTEVAKQTFGEDADNVSGFIVGGSQADVETLYESLKAGYTQILRNEATAWNKYQLRNGTYAALGNDITVAKVWEFTVSEGYAELLHRLDFSFSHFRTKPEGVFAIKYGFQVDKDYVGLVKTTTVQGSYFGTSDEIDDALNEVAGNDLDVYLATLSLGTRRPQRRRSVDRDYVPDVSADHTSLKLDFTEVYLAAITGDDTILHCEVNEAIQFSGNRNVILPIPDRKVEVQQLGKVEGSRVISGFVICANETAGLKFVKKQKTMAFGTQSLLTGLPATPASSDIFDEPPRIEILSSFLPFTDGEVRGVDAAKAPNIKKITFSFSQILRAYEYTTT